MALFEREDDKLRTDLSSQALSVIAVENDFFEDVYHKIAKVYDVMFGPILHRTPSRSNEWVSRQAIACSRWVSAPVSTLSHFRATVRSPGFIFLHRCSSRRVPAWLARSFARALDGSGCRGPQVPRRVVRHRLCAHLVNCVSDPLKVVRGNAPRVQAGRQDRDSSSTISAAQIHCSHA